MRTFSNVRCKGDSVTGISETPPTNVEALGVFGNQILWVDGLVPRLEQEIS